jgi:hypothetical protein
VVLLWSIHRLNQPSVSFNWAAKVCAFALSNRTLILTALPSIRVIKIISTKSGDFNSTSVEKIPGKIFGYNHRSSYPWSWVECHLAPKQRQYSALLL